jgi:AmmeMemoRadiSam system protein B
MSIVFSAIVPHPPILVPAIGKENSDRLHKTAAAYKKLEDDLYVTQPDVLLIISPHGSIQNKAFTLNLCDEFDLNFREFGEYATNAKIKGEVGLTYQIREYVETRAPVQMLSQPDLDHGVSVPVFMLTQNLPNIKIIPLYYSGLSFEAHYDFGKLLKRQLVLTKKRVAIIASGDLSHRLTKDSPAGYNAKGKKFDKKLIEYISNDQPHKIIGINPDFALEAGECGLRSIIILLGIISEINYTPQPLSYEAPFGVGYAVINFKINH